MLVRALSGAAVVAALAIAPLARADGGAVVVIEPLSCVPTWWDEAGFTAAVRAELRAIDVTLAAEGSDLAVELRRADCADERSIEVVVIVPDRPAVSRVVDLVDVAAVARPRALALAVASCVALALAAGVAVDAPPVELALDAVAPATVRDPDVSRSSRLASGLGSPRAPRISPRVPSVSSELGSDAGLLPNGAVALGGPRLGFTVRPWPGEVPLGLVFAARALFGAAHDALGDVEGTWLTGAVGLVVELVLDEVRFGAQLMLGVGAALQRGVPARDGVVASEHAAPTVDAELGVHADIRLAGPVFLALGAQASVLLFGLQGDAATRSALALRDVFPSVRVGVGADF